MECSWESLDIDDSDLPSVLRPCKRKTHSPPLSHSLPSSSNSLSARKDKPLIPGPAGIVQAALKRRARDKEIRMAQNEETEKLDGGGGQVQIPSTQQFLQQVVDAGGIGDADEDFSSNSWISALGFARRQGRVNGLLEVGAVLGLIRTSLGTDRVPLVVAMIKSCSPTGLGDQMLTLKDPTGTMGGTIHRKFLTNRDFAKHLCVGAVLVLQKVIVFSPTRSTRYLNITMNNLLKVFSKDGESLSPQICSTPVSKHVAADSVCHQTQVIGQKTFFVNQENTNEGILNAIRGTSSQMRVTSWNDRVQNGDTSACRTSRDCNGFVRKEPVLQKNAITGRASAITDSTGDGQEVLMGEDQTNAPSETIDEAPMDTDQETGTNSTAVNKKEKPPVVVSRTTLPHWTEEQLDELLACDFDDD